MKGISTGPLRMAMMAAAMSSMAITMGHSLGDAGIRLIKNKRKRKYRARKSVSRTSASKYTPHQGERECARRMGFGQFPEYVALEAKNIASGKWSPGIGAA